MNFLHKLGLREYYPNKLNICTFLEKKKHITDKNCCSNVSEIWSYFLTRLVEINSEFRNCTSLLDNHKDNTTEGEHDQHQVTAYDNVHPLDLIVALFLCADSCLQQEMALKMSMCQFSLPLLLPPTENSRCTLMLWALREIIKEWQPHGLSESRGFKENYIVREGIPLISFVRLKNCSLSKSQILNQVLSRGQQSQNMFIHREMEGGEVERKISAGLVEVGWFLPSGRENLDVFSNPVAFANLRGDISESQTQFTFLMEVSTAVFVFLDRVEEAENQTLRSVENLKSKMFLVVNHTNSRENMDTIKKTHHELEMSKDKIIRKDFRVNTAKISKKLCETIKTLVTDLNHNSVENMCDTAVSLDLSVDEDQTLQQKETAEKIFGDARSIPEFKNQQLPLQGKEWKSLARLERKECRIKVTDVGIEHRKCEIRAEKQKLQEAQARKKLSSGVTMFIETLLSSDKEQRDCFLRWMQFLFNSHSQHVLTELRQQFKEQLNRKDATRVAELDQKLVDSSLGLEHYMREMGLIFEFSSPLQNLEKLPGLAADLLLDGYPLELLDGEASNIPQRWISHVLMELDQKVGGRSRLLVLTVLGVQSSGKSTLLNTMFGVRFPVSSGRCTRGAYMLFLKVGEDMQCGFDFILLIDTEGLKSPELAQLDDSYEHDNRLATFVIGLSDITIINLAMENAAEIKLVLQIFIHASLRMKEIRKMPICHFVHQNVAGVAAHGKNTAGRNRLLDHLNEMTRLAAKMEQKPSVQSFTDVLDYNVDTNNWYIPGLWHGTPPMAPVNTGYSEAVADFKNKLLESVKHNQDRELSTIPEFIEWITSLWRAVKYEDFIFSFRNTLVAQAYDNLSKEFSQWEWEFRKEILSQSGEAELEIQNADLDSDLSASVRSKKTELIDSIKSQETKMREKLNGYYKRKDKHVKLIEKYKSDFLNSITSLSNEIKSEVNTNLDSALERKKASEKVQNIQGESRTMMEQEVMKLLSNVRDDTMSDEELRREFDKMWTSATDNVPQQKERNISDLVLYQLKENLWGQNVNELFFHVGDLSQHGRGQFQVRNEHIDSNFKKGQQLWSDEPQVFTNKVIEHSEKFMADKSQTNQDYSDSFTRELLQEVDQSLEESYNRHKTNKQFGSELKLHICGIAARKFQQMHKRFLSDNDPRLQLEKQKEQWFQDFLDLYRERDDCQRKAEYFVTLCIKPAVEDYINRSLGINIVDEVLTSSHAVFSSRSFFQYSILKELLLQDDFKALVKYCGEYERFVKDWIRQHVSQKLQETLLKLQSNMLHIIVEKIRRVIEEAVRNSPDDNENITELVDGIRRSLMKDVSISEEAVRRSLSQIKSTSHQFGKMVLESLSKMTESFHTDFLKPEDVTETLNQLPVKPEDELFKRVFGCGHQCPFCKVPCEAGGKDHKKHHASIHLPQAFGTYRERDSQILMDTICTTSVTTGSMFRSQETREEFVPYTRYAEYYPDWNIPPDASIQASDYWKHLLVKYNQQLAQEFDAKPAKIPELWKEITEEKALKGLREAFNMIESGSSAMF
ncbi:up-regulator of cell proliferation-like [Synchiropus splendidus]|uniref:up-regulator of cell proliferation-like n=1 Tax=Synchiropus splendidus TaxID=270530 RepID=UPI00237D351D|nr:up-regulator of cell proliferation-like [Synchiropus splendidus]